MSEIEGWEVVDEDAGVLTREYPFAKGAYARMMTARLADGRLVAISPASGMSDGAFRALERFGGVGAVIAPNGFHYFGLPSWKAAFPDATFHAPPGAEGRIAKKLPNAPALEPISALGARLAKDVSVHELPSVSIGEVLLATPTRAGSAVYVSDAAFNIPQLPSFPLGFLFWLTSSAPGFKVNGLGLKMFVKDKGAYLDALKGVIDAKRPSAVISAHGPIVNTPGVADELLALIAGRR